MKIAQLALFDFMPRYCPACGRVIQGLGEPLAVFNYHLRSSIRCSCGACFQKVRTSAILKAASECEGDLPEVVSPLLQGVER